jgi:hypothetical protein
MSGSAIGPRIASIRYIFTPRIAQSLFLEVVPVAQIQFAMLAAYDRRHFFAPRNRFLELWIRQLHVVGLAVIDAGQLKG